jgi:AcrR family transcriptional regulator
MPTKTARNKPRASTGKETGNATMLRLVDATLDLIERNGGCRGVNLRQIAARAKCAHTNLYNYYDSLESLYWAAMDRALERLEAHTTDQLASRTGLRAFLTAQLDYARQHPGLYRLFWLEPLSGKPPPQTSRRLDAMRTLWIRQIDEHLHGGLAAKNRAWAGQIVHGYFHGEVCKLIGRRAFSPTSDDDCERIVSNTLRLAELAAT